MNFIQALHESQAILTEAAIAERLRRRNDVQLHPTLFNTPLIYDEIGRHRLKKIYSEYREIAREARIPVLLCAPTWRVDRNRTEAAGFDLSLNRDAVAFMREMQVEWQDSTSPVFIGGLIGPKNDCYMSSEALSTVEAESYHAWQVDELVKAGVDVVIGQTFPAVSEALGVARACGKSDVTSIISFVLNRDGEVLDGTPIAEAVAAIDSGTVLEPAGYMVNCVHPSFLLSKKHHPELFHRLIGIQANASSLDHAELDGSKQLQQDDMQEWGDLMLSLHQNFGVKILGGCCGTDDHYLRHVAQGLHHSSSR